MVDEDVNDGGIESPNEDVNDGGIESPNEDLPPLKLTRTKSWKEYDGKDEIPYILAEGFLPVKFQSEEIDLDYEGALRFYFEDGKSELTKAVRLTNRTTTDQLIPQLVDKFSLSQDDEYALYEINEKDETFHTVLLYPDDCPLARAISNKKVPRFVLRRKDENSNSTVNIEQSVNKKEKRRKLFSFSKKDTFDVEKAEKEKKKSQKKKKSDRSGVISIEVSPLDEDHTAVYENISDVELVDSSSQEVLSEDSPKPVEDQNETAEEEVFDNNTEGDTKEGSDSDDKESTSYLDALDTDTEEQPKTSTSDTENTATESVVEAGTGTESHDTLLELPEGGSSSSALKTRTLSFSNSSLFFDQDNEPPKLVKKKDRKKKEKEAKKKRTKSDSRLRRMVLGNRKKDSSDDLATTTELSTYKLAPGILKVFGDHVSEGSNYKAVRASTISTSQEVVKMALERYGLEIHNPKSYVLCDVVGHFTQVETKKKKGSKKSEKSNEGEEKEPEEPKWITEYVRAINDNEKPLVLQSLWKPTNGRARRFELRKRHEVESSCFFINTADNMGRSTSETSLFNDSEHSSTGNDNSIHVGDKSEYLPMQMSPHSRSDKITTQRQDSEIVNRAPQFAPYLILVNGPDPIQDQIIHKLEDPTIVVGAYVESEKKQCNIVLYSSDILLPHCWIYKKVKLEENSSETNLDEIDFLVFIEPANGADITVNGVAITSTTLLKPGHLVSFGRDYVFIFKDPTQSHTETMQLPWWSTLSNPDIVPTITDGSVLQPPRDTTKRSVSVQVELAHQDSTDHSYRSDDSEDEDIGDEKHSVTTHSNLATRKKVEKSVLQLTYNIRDEEELLHSIIDIADQELGAFKLTPAYFLMMTIEHSAATFTEIQTRKLLLKMCNGLQGIAWEKTKEIGKQSSVKTENSITLLDRVLFELRPVFLWMASALEMLYFLQTRLGDYLLPREQVTTSKDALLTADEELLTVLEEVIMFTFQQTVYHLTKVLYIALPAIIDSNPFQDSEDSGRDDDTKTVHPSVANIPKIFQAILNTANEYQVHPQIVSQLFAYLFFFANASLFNALMERGPGGKFYRWTKGVQMRGNLDVLEDWAQVNGLSNQFEEYLAKFRNAVDLLSTPKVQILQSVWNELRTNYPALNPAQLQQLLSEYQLSGKPRPRGWYPPPEEVEPALRQSDVLESFATHPPLMLPSTNFLMDLSKVPSNDEFATHFKTIQNIGSEKTSVTQSNGKSQTPTTPTKSEGKSKKVRTKSEINQDDLQAAIQMKNQNNADKQTPPIPPARSTSVTVNGGVVSPTAGDSQAQVGSVKSIQVQSKKVTNVKVTTNATPNENLTNGYTGHHPQQEEVDNLINKAPSLISTTDSAGKSTESTGDTDAYETIPSGFSGEKDDVYVASLDRGDKGLGLGLIDGMFTSLNSNGIYIRTIVPSTPASEDSRLRVGDRILAVNGTTLIGADYNKAMDVILKAGNRLSFLIAKSDDDVMTQVIASAS